MNPPPDEPLMGRVSERIPRGGVPWLVLAAMLLLSTLAAMTVNSTGWVGRGAIVAGGVALGLVLFLITRAQIEARDAAELAADGLARSQRALADSERRFRTLFTRSPLSILIFAPDGQAILANEAWERMWESDRAELAGYNILRDSQFGADELMRQIERAFNGEAVSLPPTFYDPGAIGQKGRARWVQSHLYPMADGKGDHEVVMIHEDITER